MKLETTRLIITELTEEMIPAVHENSLDEDNRRFVPDEVFETLEDARETVEFLMAQYEDMEGPLVYAVLTKAADENVGYVQLVPFEDGTWEVGYHIGKKYTGKGYATEAVTAFLPAMADTLKLTEVAGICLQDNAASIRVLQKCGFETIFEGMGEYQGEDCPIVEAVWRR